MLSPRGSLSVDERTNTLLVQDTSEKLATSGAWCRPWTFPSSRC